MTASTTEMANFAVVSLSRRVLEGKNLQLTAIRGWLFQTALTLVSGMTVKEWSLNPKTNYPLFSLKCEDIKVD